MLAVRSCRGEIGDDGSPNDPGFMFDIFARVGGDDSRASVHTMVQINSGNVIGDNIWLWRADHNKLQAGETPGWNYDSWSEYHLVQKHECRCAHGLEVSGRNVTMYALFVEHTLESLTLWMGDGGKTFFYQSELPYDVSQEDYADRGYCGYEVDKNVQTHEAYGVGVYSFFRDSEVFVPMGIRTPSRPGVKFVNPFTKYLNGHGGIKSIINGVGETEQRRPTPRLRRKARY